MIGSLIALFKWNENIAKNEQKTINVEKNSNEKIQPKGSIRDALHVMSKDKRILLVGAVQALFEGAMYIFVLQWPPIVKQTILNSTWNFNPIIPYGKIFSCFMACCLLGSTAYNTLQSKSLVSVETSATFMLILASIAMGIATTFGNTSLLALIISFFLFEACVGFYFPSIGLLRSKYIPDSHRSVIMNIFGIPLNLIVVSVFLSIKTLGVSGALGCSTIALTLASIMMILLNLSNKKTDTNKLK